MLFNSSVFLLFFVIIYALYLLLAKRFQLQNILLLIGSFIFYGWWDWRFLSLLVFSLTLDWCVGLLLERTAGPARRWLLLGSVAANLGILGFFKYFNFFADGFAQFAACIGLSIPPFELSIILPLGLSFYTFQSLSYTIDVYRREIPACRRWRDFALYVCFFPQLVAGPIERASTLIPLVLAPRTITSSGVHTGIWLIVIGYFKKMVIADNLSPIVNAAFAPGSTANGPAMWLAVLAFAFQIYADFSGYSDIARGLARLLGFDLMVNFRCPFFAANPSDFWRRWHISLSSWLRDYLYIPLGGSRAGPIRTHFNLMATMALGGLWHGARWNFVIWGVYHGSILVAHRWLAGLRAGSIERLSPSAQNAISIPIMFVFTLIGWIIFRCQDAGQIVDVLHRCAGPMAANAWEQLPVVAACVLPLVALDLLHQCTGDLLAPTRWNHYIQASTLSLLLAAIGIWGVRESHEFIYFQF